MATRSATSTLATRPMMPEIVLDGVSWDTYELLIRDLAESHVRMTYDTGTLAFDRRGEEVGVIEPVSWETYEALLHDLQESRVRITYDQGRLWIMSPTHRHEKLKGLIGKMIASLAMEHRIPISSFGSATWRLSNLEKGLESDECYYVQNEPKVRSKDDIDLKTDPPPDLAIEIEVTRPLIKRLPILSKLGVREVWHYKKEQLRALELQRGKYVPITQSLAFPVLKPADLNRFLKMRHTTDETSLLVAFQEWVRNERRV